MDYSDAPLAAAEISAPSEITEAGMKPGDIIKFRQTSYHLIEEGIPAALKDRNFRLVQGGEFGILIEIQKKSCRVLQGGKFLFVDSRYLSLG